MDISGSEVDISGDHIYSTLPAYIIENAGTDTWDNMVSNTTSHKNKTAHFMHSLGLTWDLLALT